MNNSNNYLKYIAAFFLSFLMVLGIVTLFEIHDKYLENNLESEETYSTDSAEQDNDSAVDDKIKEGYEFGKLIQREDTIITDVSETGIRYTQESMNTSDKEYNLKYNEISIIHSSHVDHIEIEVSINESDEYVIMTAYVPGKSTRFKSN